MVESRAIAHVAVVVRDYDEAIAFYRDVLRFEVIEGVQFAEEPRQEGYGTVAVFVDLYGNRWDLVEQASSPRGE